MNLLYSVNSDNDNTSDIFNSLISFQQEENNNISFMDYDSKLEFRRVLFRSQMKKNQPKKIF